MNLMNPYLATQLLAAKAACDRGDSAQVTTTLRELVAALDSARTALIRAELHAEHHGDFEEASSCIDLVERNLLK